MATIHTRNEEVAIALIRYAVSKRGTGAVIVTVSSPRQLEVARKAGANFVILPKSKQPPPKN